MTKYYVDLTGAYLGAFDGAEPNCDYAEVLTPPLDGRMVWDFENKVWLQTVEMLRQNVLDAIQNLEAQITPRRLRDAVLGLEGAKEWLVAKEDEIAALRAELAGLE